MPTYSTEPPRKPSPAPTTPPDPDPPPTGGVPSEYLEPIVADAADHAGVPVDEVAVTRAEPAIWNDGSLGCPEPGMAYIQVIIDGYWVELTAGGRNLDYRLDGEGRFVLCDQPDRQPPFGADS